MKRFQQVNVFGSDPLAGNPLAVVLDADDLGEDEMQRFTRWMNLSETAFVSSPTTSEANYKVRIFTLARELPFAGHPTLGSCHAWLNHVNDPGDSDVVVQECGAGLVPIRRSDDQLAFAAPPLLRDGPVEESFLVQIASVLGISKSDIVEAKWADNGPGWVAVLLSDAEAVLELEPDASSFTGEGSLDIGVVGPHETNSPYSFEVRAFFTDDHSVLREDPVTGSLNASLGQWLLETDRAEAPYVARQGTRLGRAGEVTVDQDRDGTVWIAGTTSTVVCGEVSL